jgi:hypothetical protein
VKVAECQRSFLEFLFVEKIIYMFYGGSFRKSTVFVQVRNFFPLPYLLPAPHNSPCYNLLRSGSFKLGTAIAFISSRLANSNKDPFASRTLERRV